MSAHARFSPSSAHRWIRCPGSLALEEQLPKRSTAYADEGTVAHEVGALALQSGNDATAYVGRVFTINGKDWTVSKDMADHVQTYIDAVREAVAAYKLAGALEVELMVEVRVDFSPVIDQPDSFGTSDVIILATWKDGTALIDVQDLKFGYNIVNAEKNEQMMTYALGAINDYGLLANFTRAKMTIHQPRQNWVSTWECTVEELEEFAVTLKDAARIAVQITEGAKATLVPGEKQCQWCRAKATCPALRSFVEEVTLAKFDDLTAPPINPKMQADQAGMETLEKNLMAVGLVEDWCKAQRAEMERRLFAGEKSSMFKIVQGKKGNRAWSNKNEVEEILKNQMRLTMEEMYSFTLITPPALEKTLAKKNPRRWKTLVNYITQSEGKPHVAPATDPRPPLDPSAALLDGFDDETGPSVEAAASIVSSRR